MAHTCLHQVKECYNVAHELPFTLVVWLAKGCLNSTLLSSGLCYSFTCSTDNIAKYPGFLWTKTVTTMLLTVMKVQQWDWWGLSDKRWASEGLEPKGCALGKMCSAPRSMGKNTRTQATFNNQCLPQNLSMVWALLWEKNLNKTIEILFQPSSGMDQPQ